MSAFSWGWLHDAVWHQTWLRASQEHHRVKAYYSKMEILSKVTFDLRKVNGTERPWENLW